MIISMSDLSRALQLFAALYVCISVLYTTHYFLASPLHAFVSMMSDVSASLASSRHWQFFPASFNSSYFYGQRSDLILRSYSSKQAVLYWNTSSSNGSSQPSFSMEEDLFLSKAFANSLHPSKIIPFFYRASGDFDSEDITVTTLITSNRFPVFARLVEHYQGPISVTIHVKNNTMHVFELLDSIHDLYASSPNMARYVDVHLVIDAFDRQFNTWRNIARLFARTDYVMMLDIDFLICTDFRRAITNSKPIMEKLREGRSAFVIPAFEFVNTSERIAQADYPTNKQALLSLVNSGRVDMFHATWQMGHNSTDYPRYYSASPGAVYKVTRYQPAYEPYVIFKKEGPPWCDERFVGYGGNKAACLFEMYLSGISYYVLSDHFIVHQNHPYEEKARKSERKINRRIYSEFKEEACLRYIKYFHESGQLNTSQGYNAQEQCKNLEGFSRIATQLIGT